MIDCPGCGLVVDDMGIHARERHHVEPEALAPVAPLANGQKQDERPSGLIVVRDRPADGPYL
jgi:hypothetical protein